MTLSSRTYLAMILENVRKVRGCANVETAGFIGSESESMLTKSVRSASYFCSSFMLFGLTSTPSIWTRSKNVSHTSTPHILAISATDFPSKRFSEVGGTRTTSTFSQLLLAWRYQFSQFEVVSI